jgi:2-polyprenyl-3-methyl-5-hydroxy-6-metoxy-1,4-benzoquinol methylase
MRERLRRYASLRRRPKRAPVTDVGFRGHEPLDRRSAEVDGWTDDELRDLNQLLPWAAFTTDTHGRRVGAVAWEGKRDTPQKIPDDRIVRLDGLIGLQKLHVLEVGCFEGVHTIALCDRAARVTALDSRVENVVKTTVRAGIYGCRPEVVLANLETLEPGASVLSSDVLHHNGVLYHLTDPVRHLRSVLSTTRKGLLLDTHVARDEQAVATYDVDGRSLRVYEYEEAGVEVPFAGMRSFARWLRREDLRDVIESAGFEVLLDELRDERNGARVLMIARRL